MSLPAVSNVTFSHRPPDLLPHLVVCAQEMGHKPTAVLPCRPPSKQLKHAQGHRLLLGVPYPRRDAIVMHEAPCSKAARATHTPPRIHPRQAHAKTDEQHSRQANLPGAAVMSFRMEFLLKHSSTGPAAIAGKPEDQAGPNISRLAPHLQREWDHAANAYLGRVIITPQSGRKVWWSSGMCKTGQAHRWQTKVSHRSDGACCPYKTGKAVCPCNDLAHNHPEVAAEWDWEANGQRTPESVAAGSQIKAAWRCGLCGHRWRTGVTHRTHGSGCPKCAHEARRIKTRQPSISEGAPHLLAEWDWEANGNCGWHPDQVTLGMDKRVHWMVQNECKLGLVHRWQTEPNNRRKTGSPFPYGKAVCACNSLAVQFPQAAMLWDHHANGDMTPDNVTVHSAKVACWKAADGRQWQQRVDQVFKKLIRNRKKLNK